MPDDENKTLGFFQIVRSVLASFVGVQSDEKRERDFTQGQAKDFIFVGILLTIGFVLLVLGVVLLVVNLAT